MLSFDGFVAIDNPSCHLGSGYLAAIILRHYD